MACINISAGKTQIPTLKQVLGGINYDFILEQSSNHLTFDTKHEFYPLLVAGTRFNENLPKILIVI